MARQTGEESSWTKRTFETGATRDVDTGKLDYEGFLSPLVIQRYAQFMHENRLMRDGMLRSSDNWQRGIPLDAYMKSAWRHFHSTWMAHRGLPLPAGEDLETEICALLFNVQGYLHEVLGRKAVSGQLEGVDVRGG